MVVQDIFLAVYLAIVSAVLSGESNPWLVAGKLAISFTFLVVMFSVARWGGAYVSRLFRTKDDELFTILFFGLAVLFGGLGEVLGVSDAIGAFLIGLVLGATRYSTKIQNVSVPLRDVFGAFFFLNFGLNLDPSQFPLVIWPVFFAVVLTLVLNAVAGQIMARIYGFSAQAGINAATIVTNRGEFALILAILALTAGLDQRLQPFAGLYVLIMSVVGPLLASNSEKIGAAVLRTKKVPPRPRAADSMLAEEIALIDAATSDSVGHETSRAVDRIVEQAMKQTDNTQDRAKRDDDY